MFGQLVPIGGGDVIPLLQNKIRIGRRQNCDIVLEFPNVSSNHCELELIDGVWRVRDLNSSNGTKVNGERVTVKFVRPGDVIGVAKHKFEIKYQLAAGAVMPELDENPFAMSLMEKAGLISQKARSNDTDRPAKPAPSQKAAAKAAPKPVAKTADDEALEWLTGSMQGKPK